MTDYKKIADLMQAQPVDRGTLTKDEFDKLMKSRKLSFIQEIDKVRNQQVREVWGNKNFQVIVVHTNNKYQIL